MCQKEVLIHGEKSSYFTKQSPASHGACLVDGDGLRSRGFQCLRQPSCPSICVCRPDLFVELLLGCVTRVRDGGVTNSLKSLMKSVCSGPICCTVEADERAFPAIKCEVVLFVETT